jgi:eukaryotic-like serine/threonine-protein kinase
MASAIDRHLLFGLIALQNGLVSRAQLAAAFQAWVRDKARPLADYLAERGGPDADGRSAVEAMVAVHLKNHGGDAEKTLASIPTDRFARDSLSGIGDPAIEAMLAQVGTASTIPDTDVARLGRDRQPAIESTLGQVGTGSTIRDSDGNRDFTLSESVGTATGAGRRFRVLRPHARGGLGAVFVALDGELNREVALKQILDDHADDPVSRQRFLMEAEITGGLEHPGIVPVYGLGTGADGRPYYAMRFIHGDSLKEAIDRFHSDLSLRNNPGGRSLELRQLLGRFLDVCNAIDYAHSRGVLHRDIKPANIILGAHGETLVVDWGLAKVMGRDHPGSRASEPTLVPPAVSGSAQTLPGSALGTPAYMSPEQSVGDLEVLGPPSDVYSLGATLFSLLTGKPPFEGDNVAAMLAAVQKGEFARPRKLDPSIDRGLEAVCLKAMALGPNDRYRTPRELAFDIEHWLADEPVTAHPEGGMQRLGRWLRQHRAWTYAAVATLIGISLVATIGVVVVDGARRREADVRKEAESNFSMAQQAVDDYLTFVSENTLLNIQDSVDIRTLRHELLNSALKYYERFVQARSQDPRLRRQLARAYFRVGEISREVASPRQAIAAYHRAAAIWEPLAAAGRDDPELSGELGASYLAVGKLQNSGSSLDLDGATKSLTRARAILEPLAAANPREPGYQSRLADCYSEIGAIEARRDQPGAALVFLEKARAIEQDLIRQYPDKHAYQKSLAEITNVLGYAYWKQRNNDQAKMAFRQVQEICETVSKQVGVGPKPLWLLNLVALSHSNIASIHQENRELDLALKSYEEAIRFRSALVDAHPSVIDYKVKLAVSWREMAAVQRDSQEGAKAIASTERSIDLLKALVGAHPDHAGYHAELGLSWNFLGILYDEAGKNTEAIALFEHAVTEQQRAVDQAPGVDPYRSYLANHLENLGEQFIDLGRVSQSLPLYRRSLKISRDLSAAHPEVRHYTFECLRSLFRQGTVERHDGDSSAALQAFADARKMLERWAAAAPLDAALRIMLGAVLDQEANTLSDQGLHDEAMQRLEQALVLLRPGPKKATTKEENALQNRWGHDIRYVLGIVPADGSASFEEHRWRSEALWDLAHVRRAQNLLTLADQADIERVALWKDRPADELIDLALNELGRAIEIGSGKTPVSDRAAAVRELDLDQAAANVRLAASMGFNDLRKLRSKPEATFLLSREDVKLAIMDMVVPRWPFGDP